MPNLQHELNLLPSLVNLPVCGCAMLALCTYWAEFIGGPHTKITFAYLRQKHDGLYDIDFQNNML